MKKLIKFLSLWLTISALAGCSNVKSADATYDRTNPVKLADHLYECTYNSWNEHKANFYSFYYSI